MNEQLRPLNLGEILDRTLQLYRARFLVLLGIAALPAGLVLAMASAIFLMVLGFGPGGPAANSPVLAGVLAVLFFLGAAFVALPLLVAALALCRAALNHAAAGACRGEKIDIRSSYRLAWKQGWRYGWLSILNWLATAGAPVVVLGGLFFALGIATALKAVPNDSLVGLVFLAVLLGASVFYVVAQIRLWLAFSACVVEGIDAWQAVKRGYTLSQGTRGRLFVLWILGDVLGRVLTVALAVPLIIAIELVPGANNPQHQEAAGSAILWVLTGCYVASQALIQPVYAIALMLFYYDQRIRKEGFDIEWLMEQAGMVAAPAPAVEGVPWMPPVARKPLPGPAATDYSSEPHSGDTA